MQPSELQRPLAPGEAGISAVVLALVVTVLAGSTMLVMGNLEQANLEAEAGKLRKAEGFAATRVESATGLATALASPTDRNSGATRVWRADRTNYPTLYPNPYIGAQGAQILRAPSNSAMWSVPQTGVVGVHQGAGKEIDFDTIFAQRNVSSNMMRSRSGNMTSVRSLGLIYGNWMRPLQITALDVEVSGTAAAAAGQEPRKFKESIRIPLPPPPRPLASVTVVPDGAINVSGTLAVLPNGWVTQTLNAQGVAIFGSVSPCTSNCQTPAGQTAANSVTNTAGVPILTARYRTTWPPPPPAGPSYPLTYVDVSATVEGPADGTRHTITNAGRIAILSPPPACRLTLSRGSIREDDSVTVTLRMPSGAARQTRTTAHWIEGPWLPRQNGGGIGTGSVSHTVVIPTAGNYWFTAAVFNEAGSTTCSVPIAVATRPCPYHILPSQTVVMNIPPFGALPVGPHHNEGSNPSCGTWNGSPRIAGNHAHCYAPQANGACGFTYHNGWGFTTAPGCADGNPWSWCWAQYIGLTCGTPLGYFRLADVRDKNCTPQFAAARTGNGCFLGETEITLADGSTKRIDELQAGAEVRSAVDGRPVKIRRVVVGPEDRPLVSLKVGHRMVHTTVGHPFHTERGLRRADELAAGDLLYLDDGTVAAIEYVAQLKVPAGEPPQVWNIELDTEDRAQRAFFANGFVSGDLADQNELEQQRALED